MLTTPIHTCVSDDGASVARNIFTDDEIYALEQERIFSRSWLYLAHRSQFKRSGDFVLSSMGETPVIVAMDDKEQLCVSINSCRHRGLSVCRFDHGNTKRFICPYHNWSYAVNGDLVAIPQERKMSQKVDKSQLGLHRVPRVEEYRGLIFACMNPDAQPLETYLGDMRFHLDLFFDRFEDGVEVVGGAHKWQLKANWKMPVENQMGDVGHGSFLHTTMLSDPAIMEELELYGINSAMPHGHGSSLRMFPEDADWKRIAWGMEGIGVSTENKEYLDYIHVLQQQAEKRLGASGRFKGLTCGVYPNFNFLWSNAAIRVSHPRAANTVDYWTWWVVPTGAPPAIKKMLRMNYNLMFGPAGMLEQEDAEAWTQQHVGSNIKVLGAQPYYYGLGLGEERSREGVPGMTGNCYNELYARGFYKQWRADMASPVS